MTHLKHIVFYVLLISSQISPAFALTQQTGVIRVNGTAVIKVEPDLVELTLGVETQGTTAKQASASNDSKTSAVLLALKNLEIEPKYIKTDFIQLFSEYDNHTLIGFKAQKSLVVTLKQISLFEKVITAAVDAGANHILDVNFISSDLRTHRDKARAMAIKAAREKAEGLVEVLGQTIGKAVSISEGQHYYSSWYNRNRWHHHGGGMQYQNVMQNVASQPGQTGETTSVGMIEVSASVDVGFTLN